MIDFNNKKTLQPVTLKECLETLAQKRIGYYPDTEFFVYWRTDDGRYHTIEEMDLMCEYMQIASENYWKIYYNWVLEFEKENDIRLFMGRNKK